MITKVESNTRGWLTCADYTFGVRTPRVSRRPRRKRRLLFRAWRRTRGDGPGKMVERNLVRWQYISGEGARIGNTCVFVCAVRYIFAIRAYSRVYVGARVGALTRDRQTRIYQGGCARVHRPIGSKHSLSTRVSWTHASRTRRGLGPPSFEYVPFFSGH